MRHLTKYMLSARSRLTTGLIVCVTLVAGGELANAATWTPAASTSPTSALTRPHDGHGPALEANAGPASGAASAVH